MIASAGRKLGTVVAAAGMALAAASGAVAAEDARVASAWALTHFSQARLVAAADGIGADGKVRAGFHVRLDPGWHLYWRKPGQTGMPPQFDFAAATNVAAVAIDWPVPKRVAVLGFDTFVYDSEVVLPMTVEARDASKPVHLDVATRFAICSDVCTYHSERFVLHLPAGPGAPTAHADLIAQFAARVPPRRGGPFEVARIAVDGDQVLVELRSPAALGDLDAAVEGPPGLEFGRPAVSYGAARRTATMAIPMHPRDREVPKTTRLTLTIMDGPAAIERRRLVTIAR